MKHNITEILLVDDSDDEVFISNLLLSRDNINIELKHFWNYKELSQYLDKLVSNAPSILAVDLNMPSQSGTELIAELYSNYNRTTVIAGIFSGSEDPKDKEDSYDAGALFFIPKPMNKLFFVSLSERIPEISFVTNDDDSKDLYYDL